MIFRIFVVDSVSHCWSVPMTKLQTSTCFVSRKTCKIGSVSNTCSPHCMCNTIFHTNSSPMKIKMSLLWHPTSQALSTWWQSTVAMETWWTTYTRTSTRSCSTTLRKTRRTLAAASLEGAPLSAKGKGESYLLIWCFTQVFIWKIKKRLYWPVRG